MLKFELIQTTNIQLTICYVRKISDFSVAQILVCQESTTAIKWLNAVDKMMVGPSESLYRRWL